MLRVQNENSSLFLNNYGVSNYVNVMDKDYADFYHGLENVGTRLLDTLDNDNRTILEELESVKYFFAYPEEKSYIPFGYEYMTSEKGVDVYKNQYPLPLGYSYSKYIPKAEYDKLSSLEKQEVLMKAAVINECSLDEIDYNSSVIKDEVRFVFHGCEFDPISKLCRVTEPGDI